MKAWLAPVARSQGQVAQGRAGIYQTARRLGQPPPAGILVQGRAQSAGKRPMQVIFRVMRRLRHSLERDVVLQMGFDEIQGCVDHPKPVAVHADFPPCACSALSIAQNEAAVYRILAQWRRTEKQWPANGGRAAVPSLHQGAARIFQTLQIQPVDQLDQEGLCADRRARSTEPPHKSVLSARALRDNLARGEMRIR